MGEDEKMLKIGTWALLGVLFLTVILQVCYRTQNRTRKMIKNEIINIQRQTTQEQARFESFARPEFLRDKVVMINPKSETVGYSKNISINDLGYKQ